MEYEAGSSQGYPAPVDRWSLLGDWPVANVGVSVRAGVVMLTATSPDHPARPVTWSFDAGYALYVADVLASHARYVLGHPARKQSEKG